MNHGLLDVAGLRSPKGPGVPAVHASRCRPFVLIVTAMVVALFSASCQPPQPVATPTATRTPILPTATATPIPTSTPTATPTVTPTPTPTLPPGLIIGGSATDTDVCPQSPADLYFLRNGEPVVCAAEGGPPTALLSPDAITGDAEAGEPEIGRYDVSQDRRHLTLITSDGQVSVLDRTRAQLTAIPTAGRIIDAARGTYVALLSGGLEMVYLGWGIQTDPGPALATDASGVIFAVDALSPTLRQRTLGTCEGSPERPCAGFLVSPDESLIAVADGEGIWLLDRTSDTSSEGTPSYIGVRPEGPLQLHSWSPDGRWLLLTSFTIDGDRPPAFVLLSADSDRAQIRFEPFCSEPCAADTVWAPSSEGPRLWLTWDVNATGCIASVDTIDLEVGAVPVLPDNRICEAQSVTLQPTSPIAGPAASQLGGLVAFLQASGPGVAAGIYALDTQASLRGVALLPEQPQRVIWSTGGEAFLTLDAGGRALRMGSPPTAMLWNVERLLDGAVDFIWRPISAD